MKPGKFNILIDGLWGSSGKGKMTTYLADKHNVTHVSSSNYPNAGHSAVWGNGYKFVAKAIPTCACLKAVNGTDIECFISPGSGFSWVQFYKEWNESGRPKIFIHDRASIVTENHKSREASGSESTKHIASTMQGSATAMCDKILRKQGVELARDSMNFEVLYNNLQSVLSKKSDVEEFMSKVQIIDASQFRNMTWNIINEGHTWLHEGSQGFALSIDHGSHYPHCTSRNCTVQASMDYMAIPPSMVGDVYLNLRTYPIRVGNVIENGEEVGFSGDFYPDCKEMTWEQIADLSGMPESERNVLTEKERTTVTKRVRRVSTFSYQGLQDAVKVNGATKLSLNFIQYLNWNDAGLKGGMTAFNKLSKESRAFISKIEESVNIPVSLIGTGANHDEIIDISCI